MALVLTRTSGSSSRLSERHANFRKLFSRRWSSDKSAVSPAERTGAEKALSQILSNLGAMVKSFVRLEAQMKLCVQN
jgi:hypothetical protein